jgi:2'-5' RNA ligase
MAADDAESIHPQKRPLEAEPKVHRTAVVLIPPEAVWEPIQAIRRVHDPQVRRWMPHVTLLYPFVPQPRLAEAADRLRPAAAQVEPFEITLREFGCFAHGRRSATLWLRPEPEERAKALQAALEAAMPWCDDVSRFAGGFAPHLSVGRFPGRGAAERAAAALEAGWEPLRFVATKVALIARSGAPGDAFSVRTTLPLG